MTRNIWTAIAVLIGLIAQPLALRAAEIVKVSTLNCDIQLSKRIVRGDADKLRALLFEKDPLNNNAEQPWRKEAEPPKGRIRYGQQIQLCLDSEGGNFAEAVKIIRLILTYSSQNAFDGLMTVIEANRQCLSACALVFMAGRRHPGDDYTEIMRFMHPTAKLGFHGPFNDSEAETKDPQLLAKAQRAGVNAVADLLDLDDDLFPRTLMTAFLRIPGNDFFYANTVGHVGKWNIKLFDYRRPVIANMGQVMELCDNTYDWKTTRVVWQDSQDLDASTANVDTVSDERKKLNQTAAALAKGVTYFTLGEYGSETNERCTVKVFRGKSYDYVRASIHGVSEDPPESLASAISGDDDSQGDNAFDDSDEESTPGWHFYPAGTKLTEIQPAIKSPRLFAAFSDPKPDDSPGSFTLNDFDVKIAISKGSWSVTLDEDDSTSADSGSNKKSAEARKAGLKPGMVLFKGTQTGDAVKGTAYAFSPNCAPTPIAVSGKVLNNRKFGFNGAPVSLPRNCGTPVVQNSGRLEFLFEPDRTMY